MVKYYDLIMVCRLTQAMGTSQKDADKGDGLEWP